MKKELYSIFFAVLLISFISAQIIIEKQPNEVYNLGESVQVPVTIKSLTDVAEIFQMNLICSGHEINFYKNGIDLNYGEQIKIVPAPSLVLTKNIIGEIKGKCKIKAFLGTEDPIFTEEFTISNLIYITLFTEKEEFNPNDNLFLEGNVIKEGGGEIEGIADIKIISNSSEITQQAAVGKGYFSSNISLPKDMKAGTYTVLVTAYDKDSLGGILNQGTSSKQITIRQIPTNLEIVFENNLVEPGTDLKVKAILHDQTGEKIESTAIITIQNTKGKILEQSEKQTDEFLELSILYNEPPGQFKVTAISNEITTEAIVNITEKKDVKIELINKTVILTNIGNVKYCNKSILIKVGEEILNLDSCLEIDEEKKYVLTAPDGEYRVEIIEDGKSTIQEKVLLTGGVVGIKETGGVLSAIKYPFVWLFIIGVLGFVAFMFFKKGYKRSLFGYISKFKKKKTIELPPYSQNEDKNKAEISLSIKGHKQNACSVCLKIKNFKEIKKDSIKETLNKLHELAKINKAVVYENQDNLIFIIAPIKTKTFSNERPALRMAQQIQEILKGHNKLFKQKIDFGIALNYGSIIAKQEEGSLKFMSIGTFTTNAKRIASLSKEEILLSREIAQKLASQVKVEKVTQDNVVFYRIQRIKEDNPEHKKFIDNFLRGLEKK